MASLASILSFKSAHNASADRNALVFDLLTKVAAGRAEFMALAEDDIDTALKRSGFIGFESARPRSSR